jgi:uncharacterized protein YabE (DUF348 family)
VRFHLRRFSDTLGRTVAWCGLFGRRLRYALTRRYVLAPAIAALALLLYSHYVTAFNVFIIFDQDKVTVHGTYTRDPEQILAEAGIFIGGSDFVSLPEGLLIGGAAEIQIVRTYEMTVSVTYDGVTRQVTLKDGTVADALAAAGYESDPRPNVRDSVTPLPNTPLDHGMEITVVRLISLTEVRTEDIMFDTVVETSKNVNAGTSVTTTEGEFGILEYTYEVVLKDGVEFYRSEPKIERTKEPVTEVVVHGTGGTVRLDCGTYRRYSKRLNVRCYAYTTERQTNKLNAIGNIARRGTIAVDPKYIPLRIDVFITSRNGTWHYGLARTEDTGCRYIKGLAIDLFMDTWAECVAFGIRNGYLYILEP